MKNILIIDCCIRSISRTRELLNTFITGIDDSYRITHLRLTTMNLQPLMNEFFNEREQLLNNKKLNHPRFDLAHQLASADEIIVAAPFWDLSFPSLLKIYFENCCVDGITFKSSAQGIVGLCQANNFVYLTTRGGFYTNDPMEQAVPYLRSLSSFFGVEKFHAIAADGMDIVNFDSHQSLENAKKEAYDLAKLLFGNTE